jgi:hypothetical protein
MSGQLNWDQMENRLGSGSKCLGGKLYSESLIFSLLIPL